METSDESDPVGRTQRMPTVLPGYLAEHFAVDAALHNLASLGQLFLSCLGGGCHCQLR